MNFLYLSSIPKTLIFSLIKDHFVRLRKATCVEDNNTIYIFTENVFAELDSNLDFIKVTIANHIHFNLKLNPNSTLNELLVHLEAMFTDY